MTFLGIAGLGGVVHQFKIWLIYCQIACVVKLKLEPVNSHTVIFHGISERLGGVMLPCQVWVRKRCNSYYQILQHVSMRSTFPWVAIQPWLKGQTHSHWHYTSEILHHRIWLRCSYYQIWIDIVCIWINNYIDAWPNTPEITPWKEYYSVSIYLKCQHFVICSMQHT